MAIDRHEISDDHEAAIKTASQAALARCWTGFPGIVLSVDLGKQTCSVQPAIKGIISNRDGSVSNPALPVMTDVPIQFPRGGGAVLTFPLAEGDEGIIIIADRCIDAWWELGGVQPPLSYRMHDLSDGMFIPGITSIPNVTGDISSTTAQLRSLDGATVVELDPAAQTVNITAPGGATITADVAITGNLTVSGTITAGTDVIAGPTDVSLVHHVHIAVKTGTDVSGEPQ